MAGTGYGRRLILAALVAAAGIAGASAEEPRLAIKGYDPVAYFDPGEPTPGDERFVTVWDGARWQFASAEHQAMFQSDPDRYAPRYGGYCAFGVSLGKQFDIDPSQWAIVDGQLYLQSSPEATAEWQKDPATRIAEADANWATMH
jgi:YHS domain-containing protein